MKIFLFIVIAGFIFLTQACEEKPKVLTEEEKYIEEINSDRRLKDSLFKHDVRYPIPEEDRDSFAGLKYFEANLGYNINAVFVEHEVKDTVEIFTTKPDDIRKMLKYGEFRFKIEGKELKLQAYVNAPVRYPVQLFLPFQDLTSGNESYEVGRYLEHTLEEGVQEYKLDFNLAYSPYCAYNDRYSCPLVPEENFLNVKILAGEKNYKSH